MASDMKSKLAAKLQANQQRHAQAPHEVDPELGRQHMMIAVDKIDPNPFQPRTNFPEDELQSLAQSIAETGLIQPIIVRKTGDRYQLIAGERRWRAHLNLKRKTIEGIVQDASDDDLAVAALVENIDREDLSDYEIGKAIKQVEFLFPSRTRLAESLGMGREDMYRYFAYDALPSFVLEKLEKSPRLLSRSAAAEIKSFLSKKESAQQVLDALQSAISLVEENRLDQTKVVDYMIRTLRGEAEQSTTKINTPLMKAGVRVGSIVRDTRNLVVKLKNEAVTEDQEKALHEYLANLITKVS